jgi:hypothetical protein
MVTKFWEGSAPIRCDMCNAKLRYIFIDGQTTMGSWGILCAKCFEDVGVGLGVGKGQLYACTETRDDLGRLRWKQIVGSTP